MKCSCSAVKMADISSEQLTTLVLFGKICVTGVSPSHSEKGTVKSIKCCQIILKTTKKIELN